MVDIQFLTRFSVSRDSYLVHVLVDAMNLGYCGGVPTVYSKITWRIFHYSDGNGAMLFDK
jgi:hypothetical protein